MGTDDRTAIAQRAAAMLGAHAQNPRRRLEPHQIPPSSDFYGWLLLGGRGSGKTAACSTYISDHVKGPACLPGDIPHWIGIIAPTIGDAVTACYEGPSGIRNIDPGARMIQAPGGTVIRWPNGSQAKMFGSHSPEDVERLRAGGNLCAAWLEEFAAWRYMKASFDQLRFGLRSGPRPHWVASTTPKPKPLLKRMVAGEIAGVVRTHATMYDNPHLPEHIKQALEDTYGGTQLGQQELYAQVLDEDSNALWTRDGIAAARVRTSDVPDLVRITVGVDPSGGAGEQGIVVAGKSGLILPVLHAASDAAPPAKAPRPEHHGYVLDDRTCCLSPDGWGRRAVQAAVDWEADDICVEVNYGGDQAVAVIATAAEALGVQIPIRQVRATRGKVVRAQPVSALTAQNRWHHAGVFPELEDQLATWYPELGWSPDRLDSAVWGAWHMKLVSAVSRGQGSLGGDLARRQIVGGRGR